MGAEGRLLRYKIEIGEGPRWKDVREESQVCRKSALAAGCGAEVLSCMSSRCGATRAFMGGVRESGGRGGQ